jgi:N-acetylglucosaminyldiphosphoundecaprenol N-acetyl-beta-D-mannosaminyltransferase
VATEVLVQRMTNRSEPALVTDAHLGLLRERVEVGGLLLDRVHLADAIKRVRSYLASGKPHQIATVNLNFVSIAARNPQFLRLINSADLAVADGMPLVWLSKLKGQPLPERVTGVDLVAECCRIARDSGRGVFLLGAAPGVADAAATELKARHPGLRVVGTYAPPVGPPTPRENKRIVQKVRAAAPGFLFVALGAPRQDLWIDAHKHELGVPVSMGVGCVLDLLAGSVRRAPVWMQRSGLEWAFRLAQEPGRLWRRYLCDDIPTLARLAFGGTLQPEADPTAALT